MGRGRSALGKSLGGEKLEFGGRSYKLGSFLDEDDIRHANDASMFDAGNATKREFIKNVKEIDEMYFENNEKKEFIKKLAELTGAQLKAEAKSVNPYVSGPARFNRQQVNKNIDSVQNARGRVNGYMKELRDKSRKNQRAYEDRQLYNAIKNAEAKGLKEVTVNGVTFIKKRTTWHSKR